MIMANSGALVANMKRHDRTADISVRVGSRDLDNTHGENRFGAITSAALPLDDKPDSIARVLWLNTDRMYKKATQGYLEVKTNTKVRAQEEDSSPDFSVEKPQTFTAKDTAAPKFNQHEWEDRIRRYSAIFSKYPDIENSMVVLLVQDSTRYFVSSEGSRLVRTEAIREVGLLDERFFMYYEDTDWGLRMRKASWRVITASSAKGWHKDKATAGNRKPYFIQHGYFMFLYKNFRRNLPHALRIYARHYVRPHLERRQWRLAWEDAQVYLKFISRLTLVRPNLHP